MNEAAAAVQDAQCVNVVVERSGALGVIRLDRPEALNATTLGMIRAIDAALDDFERDPTIGVVLIEGAGDRAFCAGGDIRAIHDSGRAGDDLAETFWREEYRLISRISRYPKPYVALMDGIVMGGGVGISVHGSRRVVTERTRFAMPEVGIGFIPDVGATFILARAPGGSGAHVALTGEPLGAADAIHVGMADLAVRSDRRDEIKAALAALPAAATNEAVDAALAPLAYAPEPGPLMTGAEAIDRAFAPKTLEELLAGLDRDGSELGQKMRATLEAKSPTSLKLALELILRAKHSPSLEDCLAREFGVARRMLHGHDFYEGIRAAVIDKDRNPRWSPARASDVTGAAVDAYFRARPAERLIFDGCEPAMSGETFASSGSADGPRFDFVDAFVSREHRFTLGHDVRSGKPFLSTPVSGHMMAAEYEEYFEIDAETYQRFRADPASAEPFLERCRMGQENGRRFGR